MRPLPSPFSKGGYRGICHVGASPSGRQAVCPGTGKMPVLLTNVGARNKKEDGSQTRLSLSAGTTVNVTIALATSASSPS